MKISLMLGRQTALVTAIVCLSSASFAKNPLPADKASGTGGVTVTGVTETTTYNPPTATEPAAQMQETRLVVDKERNTVAVLISGKEVGLFDSHGLHVTGDLLYTGVLQQAKPPTAGHSGAE